MGLFDFLNNDIGGYQQQYAQGPMLSGNAGVLQSSVPRTGFNWGQFLGALGQGGQQASSGWSSSPASYAQNIPQNRNIPINYSGMQIMPMSGKRGSNDEQDMKDLNQVSKLLFSLLGGPALGGASFTGVGVGEPIT